MKKHLFFAALLSGLFYNAQTAQERKQIKLDIDQNALQNLKAKFESNRQIQIAKIEDYLAKNPSKKQLFRKGENIYMLHHIDAEGNPIYINTKDANQVSQSKANSLYSGGSIGVNVTGSNMVAGVWDGGQVNANHELLLNKVTMQADQSLNSTKGNDHMTAVAGIMVGKKLSTSGDANGLGLTATGLAPDATTQNYDWDNDKSEMATFASNGYLISNHSYGYANDSTNPVWQFGAYDSESKAWDKLLKITPNYLPFVAVGNEQKSNGNTSAQGFDLITGSSAAKNVMTVGAVNLDKTMSDYSNWGPSDDGRVKPDIVTLGTAINVPVYNGNSAYTGVDESSSGTSYAAPAAAAAGLLLQQYYKSLFGSYMKAASLKALMLHTADDAGNAGPDAKFGWGIMNVEKAAQTIKQMQNGGSAKLVEYTTNPNNDSQDEVITTGVAGGNAARASICWTDDDGVEQTSADGVNNTSSRLIYNFDILLKNQGSSFVEARTYAPLSVTNPNANATISSDWFSNSVDNYKQANISSTTDGDNIKIYVRKKSTSPADVKNFSLLITGLKITDGTLATGENNHPEKNIVFYNAGDAKIKMISKDSSSCFGEFKIYDMSGKVVQSGHEKSKEITFKVGVKGIYILSYTYQNTEQSFKFRF